MIKISICGGMGCSSRGSDELPEIFLEEVKKANIADKVEVAKSFCMGECRNGPCVRINGVKFRHIDPERVALLVAQEVVPLAEAEK